MSGSGIPKNGLFQTSLAIISVMMGGSIVAIPYSFAVAGIKIGLFMQVSVIISVIIACALYIKTR